MNINIHLIHNQQFLEIIVNFAICHSKTKFDKLKIEDLKQSKEYKLY